MQRRVTSLNSIQSATGPSYWAEDVKKSKREQERSDHCLPILWGYFNSLSLKIAHAFNHIDKQQKFFCKQVFSWRNSHIRSGESSPCLPRSTVVYADFSGTDMQTTAHAPRRFSTWVPVWTITPTNTKHEGLALSSTIVWKSYFVACWARHASTPQHT